MGMLEFFRTPDFRDAFQIFGQSVQVFTNLKSCAIQESLTDVYAFCSEKPEACQIQKLFENLTSNMFVLMGKFTELQTMFHGFPAAESDDLYDQTFTLGNDLGTLLRVLVAYKL